MVAIGGGPPCRAATTKARPELSGTVWLKSPLRKRMLPIAICHPPDAWPWTVTGAFWQRTT